MQNEEYWKSDCYNEWLKLSKRDYHGKKCGQWYCYIDDNDEIIYKYIKNENI